MSKTSNIEFDVNGEFEMRLNDIVLSYKNGLFTLDESKCISGRTQRHIEGIDIHHVSVFVDVSSIEIFINDGEYALTSRYFDEYENMRVVFHGIEEVVVYVMKGFEIE